MTEIDYLEVGRAAHELVARHGSQNAARQATKLAERAKNQDQSKEQAFWEAVADSLRIR